MTFKVFDNAIYYFLNKPRLKDRQKSRKKYTAIVNNYLRFLTISGTITRMSLIL